MEIEKARNNDQPQIEQLLAECELPFEDITPAHLDDFLVIREGDQLVGVIGLETRGQVALLRSLAVEEAHRGRGFGAQLTSRLEAKALSMGVERLFLLTTNAEGYFDKRGYRRINRDRVPNAIQETPEFNSLCPSTAVCMVKDLGSGSSEFHGSTHHDVSIQQLETRTGIFGPRGRRGGYMVAALLGAIVGGIVVAVATKAIPRMLTQIMAGMMQNMMARMGKGDCAPPDI